MNLEFFYNISLFNLILLIILVGSGFVQLFYYLFFYLRIVIKEKQVNEFNQNVSVVICARNESDNLKKYIPLIAKQNYKNFEIIVVNDCSLDDTEYTLDRLEKTHLNLRHTTIKEDSKFEHGKKLALTVGIKSAKFEHLVLTDADCFPNSKNWLKEITKNFDNETKIVISYGAFEKENGFSNKLIRYDNYFNSLQFLTFAKAGIPYMGTGRNMAYTKSFFIENKGFASHYNIMSGDDDLFVNENSTNKNTKAVFTKDSFTYSPAKKSFEKWYQQKLRHLSTAKKYKFKHKILLSLEPLSRTIFYSLSIVMLITSFNYLVLSYILFVILSKFLIQNFASNHLDEKDLLLSSLLFDVFLPFVYLILHINGLIVKRRRWN